MRTYALAIAAAAAAAALFSPFRRTLRVLRLDLEAST